MHHAGTDARWRYVAVAIAVVVLVMCTAKPLLLSGGVLDRPGVTTGTHGTQLYALVVPLAFTLVGMALAWSRTRNAIGWLLLGVGALQATQMVAEAYGTRAMTDPDGSLPLGLFALWLASWTWLPAVAIPIVLLPPLYPYGRPTDQFWRWHLRVGVAGLALVVLLMAISQGGVDDQVEGVRLPFDSPTWLTTGIGAVGAVLLLGAAVVSLVGTVVRMTRARRPERQQLAWLVTVAIVFASTVFIPVRGPLVVAYAMFPVAVAVGVLKYQLLGIEVAVRRTLLYAPLTVLVALTVGGVTAAMARLAPDGPLPLLVASAVIAVVVFPVSAALRRLVDRLVLGDRHDPLAAVDRVGERLEVVDEDPLASVVQAVAAAVRAPYAAVLDERDDVLAVTGSPTGKEPARFPLRHGGDLRGILLVGGHLHPAERRLLDALAPHVAVVLTARRLTADLEREKERVLSATSDERERVRRELHDGLGAALSGIALGAEAAQGLVASDPVAAAAILQRVREEATSAVLEVRRVVDGLRPAALDRLELAAALEQAAHGLGFSRAGAPEFDLRVAEPLAALPPEIEVAAFRIASEAMANVARHAGARSCRLELARSNGHLVITVSDDGTGYREPRAGGVGIPSMRRRAEQVRGNFSISAPEGGGTRVEAKLPVGEAP